MQIIINVCAAL